MKIDLTTRERWIVLALSVFAIIAHLVNLGLMPLMADEAIRATVAFEMMKSNDYIVPTIWGEYYYRKPPLYNWIIVGFFKLFDSYSEFVFRLPSVIPHFLLALATWFVSRKHIGEKAGIFAAFGFLLSGRLLTRDSMLGHIDLAFSLVTFVGFFVVYYFHKRKQFFWLFLLSYLLAAIGTLMKGLPSILFQVLTVGVWFLYKRDWIKLISINHAIGILSYIVLVGGYFFWYSQYNGLDKYFGELYGQAAMRTVVDRPWYDGILNIFTFPFENFGHLFPTSLMFLFALRKGIIRKWLSKDFTAFVALILAVNLLPYWLSPGYFPRYLFMLYPLCFILVADAMMSFWKEMPRTQKLYDGFYLIVGVIITLALFGAFFVEEFYDLNYFYVGVFTSLLIGVSIIFAWFKQPDYRLYYPLFFIVLFRLGFDLFVLPYRIVVEKAEAQYRKDQSAKIVEMTGEGELLVFDSAPLFIDYAYYLGIGKDRIMKRVKTRKPDTYYLVEDSRLDQFEDSEKIYRFHAHYQAYFVSLVLTPEEISKN